MGRMLLPAACTFLFSWLPDNNTANHIFGTLRLKVTLGATALRSSGNDNFSRASNFYRSSSKRNFPKTSSNHNHGSNANPKQTQSASVFSEIESKERSSNQSTQKLPEPKLLSQTQAKTCATTIPCRPSNLVRGSFRESPMQLNYFYMSESHR